MTIICNIFGGPGCGKSTARADTFRLLKHAEVNCEEVYETAKKLHWEKRTLTMNCQPYIFAKQLRDIEVLTGQVDVIITDSPLLLSRFYNIKYCDGRYPASFNDFILEQFNQMGGLNFFLQRTKTYNPSGRYQAENEANQINTELRAMLDDLNVSYTLMDGDINSGTKISNAILEALKI